MKIGEQVLSIEQARHLQELGLDMSDATHTWVSTFEYEFAVEPKTVWQVSLSEQSNKCGIVNEIIPTYTLQEGMITLPISLGYYSLCFHEDNIGYYDSCGICYKELNFLVNPLYAVYCLLCWVLENGYMKGK